MAAKTRRVWRGLNRARIRLAIRVLTFLIDHARNPPAPSILTVGGVAAAVIVRTDLQAALVAMTPA
jgi:hypothetical protein